MHQDFYKSRLFYWLNGCFLGFLVFSVLLPWDNVFQGLFFVGVIPSILLAIKKYPELMRASLRPFYGMILLISFMVISSFLVSDAEFSKSFQNFRYGIELFFLMAAVSICVPFWLRRPLFFASLFFVACIMVSVYGVFDYFFSGRFPERLTIQEISFLKLPILGAGTLFGFWLSGFLIGSTSNTAEGYVKALQVTAFLSIFVYVVLSQSRGVILAVCVFLLLLFSLSGFIRKRSLAIILALGAGGIFVFAMQGSSEVFNFFESMYDRGTSYRLDIWTTVLKNPPDSILLGSGVATEFAQTPAGKAWVFEHGWSVNHTHNLFLGIYYSGGLVSLVGFVTCLGAVAAALFRSSWSYRVKVAVFSALAGSLVLTLTDTYQFIEKPKPIWWIFWMPFLLSIAIAFKKAPYGNKAEVCCEPSREGALE